MYTKNLHTWNSLCILGMSPRTHALGQTHNVGPGLSWEVTRHVCMSVSHSLTLRLSVCLL